MMSTDTHTLYRHIPSIDSCAQLPEAVFLAADVRELDRYAIEDLGIDGFALMDKAARFAFHALLKHWPDCDALLVVCGSGNNGGDGYLMAAMAQKRGMQAMVLYASEPEKLQGDARRAYLRCQEVGVPCFAFESSRCQALPDSQQTVLVDALLGTGLNAPVRDNYAEIIAHINHLHLPKLAVDIPSGLCANTGQVLGCSIKAHLTTTFIGLKLGLFTGHGRDYCGKMVFSGLGLPEEVFQHRQPVASRLDLQHLLGAVTPRASSTHKGQCGHVMVLGGDIGFGGAALMAAKAAARMGAGLTSIITREAHRNAILSQLPEAMIHCPENASEIKQLIDKADVLIIGPGLGQSAWAEKLLLMALESDKALVFDADALNLIASEKAFHNKLATIPHALRARFVYTPHPGEAARLLACSTGEIQADRLASIRKLHHKLGGHILLKGSGSLLINGMQEISVCPYGNPGMASGGMGDVLSGFIGGLMAQGFASAFALQLAVTLHACAADIASESEGERGLLAGDLIAPARKLLNHK